MSPQPPESPETRPPGARRGRRIAQVIFFSGLVWVIVSGGVEILGETFFAPKVARAADACQGELALLRARLADASLHEVDQGELAAVRSFRNTLGGEGGRAWDARVLELIDGCPPTESSAAYALARLRAAHEAMVRIDAREIAPARAAHRATFPNTTPSTHP